MALDFTNNCISDVIKLKKSDCGFVPKEITRVIGIKASERFDATTDTLDDAKIGDLVKQQRWFSFDFVQSTDNSTEAPTEDFDGLTKISGSPVADYDFTLACLSTCQMIEFGKIKGSYSVIFEIKGECGNKKLMFAVAPDGKYRGFSTTIFQLKSRTLGTRSTVNKLVFRIQLDEEGSTDFLKNFAIVDNDLDLDNYNVGGVTLNEVSAPVLAGTDLTVEVKAVDNCNGVDPLSNIAADGFAITDASGNVIQGTATEGAGVNAGVYTVTFAGVASGTYDLALFDTATASNIVAVDDCYFSATNYSFAV